MDQNTPDSNEKLHLAALYMLLANVDWDAADSLNISFSSRRTPVQWEKFIKKEINRMEKVLSAPQN